MEVINNTTTSDNSPAKEIKNPNELSVNVDLKAKPKDEPMIIDFKKSSDIGKMLQQPTENEKINNNTQAGNTNGIGNGLGQKVNAEGTQNTVVELQKLGDNASYSDPMAMDDYKDVAALCIEGIDFIAVGLLQWFAQSKNYEDYTVPKERLERLKVLLVRILAKMQKKFPLEFLFLATLVLAYFTPARKAWMHRKVVMEKKAVEAKAKALADKTKMDLEKIQSTQKKVEKQYYKQKVVVQPITKQTFKREEPAPQEYTQTEEVPIQKQQTETQEQPIQKPRTVSIDTRKLQSNEPAQGVTRKAIIPKASNRVPVIPRTGKKMGQ